MILNFYFIRHGLSCYNAIKNQNVYEKWDGDKERASDPHLTNIGVYNSILTGKWLKQKIGDNRFDIVFSSPLIRAMETAQLTSLRKNKVRVVPYLREIDEHSSNKNSKKSIKKMLSNPAYKKLKLKIQKKRLNKHKLLYYKNRKMYKFYDTKKYNKVGDINNFLNYFYKYFYKTLPNKEYINILIVSHAGVLKDYYKKSFNNNDGFYIRMNTEKQILKKKSLNNPYLSKIYNLNDVCGNDRCELNLNVCKVN